MPRRNGTGIALLADPLRLRIVALLALGRQRPSVIADQLGISRSTATRQLRLLCDVGLVLRWSAMIDRRRVIYMIEPRRLGIITAWLAGTRIGLDTPHPVFVLSLREKSSSRADSD